MSWGRPSGSTTGGRRSRARTSALTAARHQAGRCRLAVSISSPNTTPSKLADRTVPREREVWTRPAAASASSGGAVSYKAVCSPRLVNPTLTPITVSSAAVAAVDSTCGDPLEPQGAGGEENGSDDRDRPDAEPFDESRRHRAGEHAVAGHGQHRQPGPRPRPSLATRRKLGTPMNSTQKTRSTSAYCSYMPARSGWNAAPGGRGRARRRVPRPHPRQRRPDAQCPPGRLGLQTAGTAARRSGSRWRERCRGGRSAAGSALPSTAGRWAGRPHRAPWTPHQGQARTCGNARPTSP